MSRVGKRIINLPNNVEFNLVNNYLNVKGPLGTLERQFSPLITINRENQVITTTRANEEKHTKQLHGTTNALIANMIHGVSQGYSKTLLIEGVGYRATLKGKILEVAAGYSHLVNLEIPASLVVEVAKPTQVVVKGIDKQVVGQFAAELRQIRRANVYSGKGIKYSDEIIRRKEGKKSSK